MDDLPSIIAANSRLNNASIKKKVFCIGLHKQGTTSLSTLAALYGFKSNHSTGWFKSLGTLEEFDFFSDGGSHYDHINEIPYKALALSYPHSLFILQTRDPLLWLLSKLSHAGWSEATQPTTGDPQEPPVHSMWREKTLLNIDRFLIHKRNYESRVKSFFREYYSERLLEIDVTGLLSNEEVILRIENFLGVKSVSPLSLPHCNMRRAGIRNVVSEEVYAYIVQKVNEIFG